MSFSPHRSHPRLSALALAGALAWGSLGTSHAAQTECFASTSADSAKAKAAAHEAAEQKLASLAPLYRLMYREIQYDIQLEEAKIEGDRARVTGSLTLRGRQRLTGKALGETFHGVVLLRRQGCSWQAEGYRQL